MSDEIAGALQGLPLDTVDVGIRPVAPILGRRPFPLLDLRRRPEEFPPFSGAEAFRNDSRFLRQQYAAPVDLKPDPLHAGRDATLFGGAIWAGGQLVPGSVHHKQVDEAKAFRDQFDRYRRTGRLPRLPGTTALIHTPGFRNYFHWMTESLPRLTALSRYLRLGIGPLDRILISQPEPKDFILDSVATFFPELLSRIEVVPTARYDLEHALFFLDWRGIGSVSTRIKDTTAAFFEEIEGRLREVPHRAGRSILISRADVDNRRLVNEDALLEAFAPLGLESVRFTGMTVTDQMRLMSEAKLVVGVHGAGLTNTIFCRPGTALLEITSTQYIRRARSYADIAAFRRFPYALAVVDQRGDDWVVTKNRGNDLEIAVDALPELRRIAEDLLGAAPQG